jgi:GT2 family glycosyltransferase
MANVKIDTYNLVVIPVLNNLRLTKQLLKSIKSRHKTFVLIIDNNSTDGTCQFLQKFISKPGCAALRFNENQGAAKSWNYGINFALQFTNAKFITILNNDIILHPDCLDKMIETQKKTGAALVSAYDYAPFTKDPTDILTTKNHLPPEIKETPHFSCFLIPRETITEIGTFDQNFHPAYFEDNDYHYRIKIAGKVAYQTTTALFHHFVSQTAQNNPEIDKLISETYNKNEKYFIRKWGGRPGHEKYKIPFNKKE